MQLIVTNLHVERGGRRVLSGISFSLAKGEALIVAGPNGAGKSTLLRALAGLLAPSAGTIRLEGGEDEIQGSEKMHLVGHRDGVKEGLTAAGNLTFWRDFFGKMENSPTAVSVDEALAAVALEHAGDLPAGILSAGQRRRLALARLLVAPRPIWLLDEPTTALDRASQIRLAVLVAQHREHGGMVIASTHSDPGWPDVEQLDLGERA